jgi:hypothetical protein
VYVIEKGGHAYTVNVARLKKAVMPVPSPVLPDNDSDRRQHQLEQMDAELAFLSRIQQQLLAQQQQVQQQRQQVQQAIAVAKQAIAEDKQQEENDSSSGQQLSSEAEEVVVEQMCAAMFTYVHQHHLWLQ